MLGSELAVAEVALRAGQENLCPFGRRLSTPRAGSLLHVAIIVFPLSLD